MGMAHHSLSEPATSTTKPPSSTTEPASSSVQARRTKLRDECRFLSSHAFVAFDAAAAASDLLPPAWPVGPRFPLPLDVPGLTVLPDYCSDEEHQCLLDLANDQKPTDRPEWLIGTPYEHVCVTCPQVPTVELYIVLRSICSRLQRDGLIDHMPRTLTINYYEPHEGLRPHTDNPDVIAELVLSISLGSACVMDFASAVDSRRRAVLLEPRTVVIMQGAVRYEWTHGIACGATHALPDGSGDVVRGSRVSVQLSDFDPRFFSTEAVQRRRLVEEAAPEACGETRASQASSQEVDSASSGDEKYTELDVD